MITLLALLVLSSCERADRRISAVVLAVDGQARASFHDRAFSLTKGSPLQPGTVIEVSPGCRLDLMLLPGIRVALTGESRAEIGSLHLARDGDETIEPMTAREARLTLSRGTLLASIGRVQTRSRLRVTTLLGTLSAGSGRLFKLTATEAEVRFVSFRGKLNFAPAGSAPPIKIDQKSAARWLESGRRAPETAASESVTAEETTAALAQEERLLELERHNPPPFIPWRINPQP